MLQGTALSGYNVNQLELSPNYAGTLRGGSSTLANICGFATPALVGTITQGEVGTRKYGSLEQLKQFWIFIPANNRVLEQGLLCGSWNVRGWNCNFPYIWTNIRPEMEQLLGARGQSFGTGSC